MRTDPTASEKIEKELLEMKDGWDGPGSRAPAPEAVANLINHIACLPEPSIDVDREGIIFARWSCPDSTRIFTLGFSGNQVVNDLTVLSKAN